MNKVQKVDSSTVFALCRAYVEDWELSYADCAEQRAFTKYVLGLIRARKVKALCSLSAHDLYREALQCGNQSFIALVLQVEAFFKKNASLRLPTAPTTAMEKFHDAEKMCQVTNSRLNPLLVDWQYAFSTRSDSVEIDYEECIVSMSRDIEMLLGSYEVFEQRLPYLVRLTSGATASLSKRNSTPIKKLGKRIACSAGLVNMMESLALCFGYSTIRGTPTNVNRVTTVPKNWKTDRTIACEPTGNIPFQLAFDTYVKNRLRQEWGVDLSDQSKNQRYALAGSIFGSHATIDLESASDTLSTNVVRLCLPAKWYRYVERCRSSFYRLPDGSWGKYEKFSSMGNGTTFTLETLVFAAAIRSLGIKQNEYAVYGDDLCVPTERAQDVINLLDYLGFKVNTEKTFTSGSYRESCGKHYVSGSLVTPFYVRKLDQNASMMDLSLIINSLAVVAEPNGNLWKVLRDIYRSLKTSIPLVPFSVGNDTAGVQVTLLYAYSQKVCTVKRRNAHWVPMYKGLVAKTKTSVCRDSRAAFLWHLQKLKLPTTVCSSSASTISTHKFLLKWCSWVPSQEGVEGPFLAEWTSYLSEKSDK